MPFEVDLQSTDPARPNDELLKQILARQGELAGVLQEEDALIKGVAVEPQAGFPTGLEVLVITVALTFGAAAAKGFAKGAGGEIGKALGEEAGKRIGARIRRWIQDTFPDVAIKNVIDK